MELRKVHISINGSSIDIDLEKLSINNVCMLLLTIIAITAIIVTMVF